MKTVLRTLAAVVAGLLAGFVVVIAVEAFSAVVHPLPIDFGGTPKEKRRQMCRHVEQYPQWVLAVVVPAWPIAAFASTWISGKIANLSASVIVGMLLLAALLVNLAMLPYPTWFKAANLVAIPVAIVAGGLLSRCRQTAGHEEGV